MKLWNAQQRVVIMVRKKKKSIDDDGCLFNARPYK